MDFVTRNPWSGEELQAYSFLSDAEIESRLARSSQVQRPFRFQGPSERALLLKAWAQSLRQNSTPLAELFALEMGKPLAQGRLEVEKSALTLEWYADQGPAALQAQEVAAHYSRSWIAPEALGVILAIMPWNFPLWQVIRFAAPSLLAGNSILMKHSDLTAGTAELIEKSFREAAEASAFSKDLFLNLRVSHAQAAQVIADPRVRGVTFTGSTRGGRAVAELAGRHLKKSVLELGGSDAYLVLRDADIERSAKICAAARLNNAGQSCVAAKRFVVERPALEAFLKVFRQELESVTPQDPLSSGTRLGPLASRRFVEQTLQQCQTLQSGGAQLLFGAQASESPRAALSPGVLLFDSSRQVLGQPQLDVELFAPVATLIVVDSLDEALEVTNSSVYGLGAAVFTQNENWAHRALREFEAGFVVWNDQVKSDPRLPFGGVKDSGYGRELSLLGLGEFCNWKTKGEAR